MCAQVPCVVANAVDQAGLAPPEERHAHQIQSGRFNDTSIVADTTLVIEDRYMQPGVIGPEAGCPHDGFDAPAGQIEKQWRRFFDSSRVETLRRLDLVATNVFAS